MKKEHLFIENPAQAPTDRRICIKQLWHKELIKIRWTSQKESFEETFILKKEELAEFIWQFEKKDVNSPRKSERF
ncbi:MAG: hypothetical protein K5764_09845 [Prevotella sp.]|nr:hypothetical protein [Prevotella sp.]